MSVELHPAYVWDCDDCGHENMVRGIEAELPDEVAETILATDKHQPDVHFEAQSDSEHEEMHFAEKMVQRVVLAPKVVKCEECGCQFGAELWAADDATEDE